MKELKKTKSTKIIIDKRSFKGRNFIDIRTHYKDDKGCYKPTGKGITLTHDQYYKFRKIIDEYKPSRKYDIEENTNNSYDEKNEEDKNSPDYIIAKAQIIKNKLENVK